MKIWIFALLSLALFGAGCAQRSELPVTRQSNTIPDATASSEALIGLNKARVKVSNQMGFCPSAVMRVGTYKETDDIEQVALNILQKRNPRVSPEYLEVVKTPFMNFTTNPPTPAMGETIRTMLHPDGSVETYGVESSQTTIIKLTPAFYNTYYSRIEDNPDCKGYRPIDNSCIGPLEFTKVDVLMGISYPC